MTPDPKTILEGTGEEVSNYAKAHPNERFRLVALQRAKRQKDAPTSPIRAALKAIESFQTQIPPMPPEAFSRDSIYD